MLSSSSGGESEESCSVSVISTTKALTAGDTVSNLMSLQTSGQSQEIYAHFQDYSLLLEHQSLATLYQYTVVALLFKRLISSPAFPNHPSDTSHEEKWTTYDQQPASVVEITSVVCGKVLCGRHVHSPEGPFMLIVALIYTGMVESNKSMAYIIVIRFA